MSEDSLCQVYAVKLFLYKKCVLAYSRASRGRLRQSASSRECASLARQCLLCNRKFRGISCYIKIVPAYRLFCPYHRNCFYFLHDLIAVKFSYFLTNRDLPVISFGCSIPISSIRVGAISARQPPSLRPYPSPAFTRINGTGFVVWAVHGSPVL